MQFVTLTADNAFLPIAFALLCSFVNVLWHYLAKVHFILDHLVLTLSV